MKPYISLGDVYDRLMSNQLYPVYARWLDSFFKRGRPINQLLELGCGTGSVTVQMCGLGYDVIGIDTSEGMLMQAQNKCAGLDPQPLLLRQNMLSLDLFGTVQGVYACYDVFNYLENTAQLYAAIHNAGFFLEMGGLLLFDVKTPGLFEKMGGTASITDGGDFYCAWRYGYDKHSRSAIHTVDIFYKDSDIYRRSTEHHAQHAFTDAEICAALKKSGFRLRGRYHGGGAFPLERGRAFYAAEKITPPGTYNEG